MRILFCEHLLKIVIIVHILSSKHKFEMQI